MIYVIVFKKITYINVYCIISVVTNNEKLESLIILGIGMVVYKCTSNYSFIIFKVLELV